MPRIAIHGLAAVFRNDRQVHDRAVLKTLDGLVYDDEKFTDYLGGSADQDRIAESLEPGGNISFGYRDADDLLSATTEYRSRRTLTEAELLVLVEYTMGQWSDGIGENWTCISEATCGYSIMCLTAGDDIDPKYPTVLVTNE